MDITKDYQYLFFLVPGHKEDDYTTQDLRLGSIMCSWPTDSEKKCLTRRNGKKPLSNLSSSFPAVVPKRPVVGTQFLRNKKKKPRKLVR